MILAREAGELAAIEGPLALSVGVFDGVHRGHQAVFATLGDEARAAGAGSLIVSLHPHPAEVLRPGGGPPLLTGPGERLRLLAEWATAGVLLQRFDRDTAARTPLEFLEQVVPPRARLVRLVIGYDFRMGKDRSGGYEELAAAGERHGFRVVRVEPTRGNGGPISSSRIRDLVREGRMPEAAELLGRPYGIEGRVVPGRGIGRTLSFPTANVDVEEERKLLPKYGVYAGLARIGGGDGPGEALPAVLNVGLRPTFGEATGPTVEVHLPGWTGDLTGRTLAVGVVDRIRDERPFPDARALAARIGEDVARARKILEGRD